MADTHSWISLEGKQEQRLICGGAYGTPDSGCPRTDQCEDKLMEKRDQAEILQTYGPLGAELLPNGELCFTYTLE